MRHIIGNVIMNGMQNGQTTIHHRYVMRQTGAHLVNLMHGLVQITGERSRGQVSRVDRNGKARRNGQYRMRRHIREWDERKPIDIRATNPNVRFAGLGKGDTGLEGRTITRERVSIIIQSFASFRRVKMLEAISGVC
jgi:hypothetical protein